MTGLEKILNEIEKQCQEKIHQIENEAKKEADELIKSEEEKIQQKKVQFDKELEKIVKLDLEKGISSALSYKKKMILEEKQKSISKIIEKSKEYITNMKKEEYMTFFEKIVLNYAHKENGKIRLNSLDKQRYGQEMVDRLNKVLTQNSKGSLNLDDKESTEKSGFVMIYGDIEENCSLEAIFSEKRELFEDKINSFLFD